MNIWFLHHYAIPPSLPGITRHYYLARELQRNGHKVTMVAADRNHRNRKASRLPDNIEYLYDTSHDVNFLWLKCVSGKSVKAIRIINMLSYAWQLKKRTGLHNLEKPDIIIGCTPNLFGAYIAKRLAKAYNAKFVFHVGEIWPLMLTELGGISRYNPLIMLMAYLEKKLYKKSSCIISPQIYLNKHIQSLGQNSERTYFIPNAIAFDTVPDDIPFINPDVKKRSFNIMYTGALGNANGIDQILLCAKEVKDLDISFLFLGGGPLKDKYIEMAQTLNLKNVKFLDPVPRNDIFAAMKIADAFIVNIPDEKPYSFGMAHNKVFDYMAMRKPTIIGSNTPDNPISEFNAGIAVPADNHLSMAHAVRELFSKDESSLEQFGKNALKGIESKYNFRLIGEDLSVLLEQTCHTQKDIAKA